MKTRKKILWLLCTVLSLQLFAQDDLMNLLEEQTTDEPQEVAYTFKSTRIISGHSIERMKSKQLDFRINHRFNPVHDGWYELWGLDHAFISFDLGYGITDWLMVGLRRSTYNKVYDGSLKFSILRQTKGAKSMPVALSYYTNMAINSLKDKDILMDSVFSYRLAYTHQMLIARKFSEALSLQLMPTYVHRNLVNFDEKNDFYSIGVGGRYKFMRRVAFSFEYYWVSINADKDPLLNPLSIGFDIETGGHVFQLFLSNSRIMEETGFLSETFGSWKDFDVCIGFNISRVFALDKSMKEEDDDAENE